MFILNLIVICKSCNVCSTCTDKFYIVVKSFRFEVHLLCSFVFRNIFQLTVIIFENNFFISLNFTFSSIRWYIFIVFYRFQCGFYIYFRCTIVDFFAFNCSFHIYFSRSKHMHAVFFDLQWIWIYLYINIS